MLGSKVLTMEEWTFILAYENKWPLADKWKFLHFIEENAGEKAQDLLRMWSKELEIFPRFSFEEKEEDLLTWKSQWISIYSESYPDPLRHIYDPPLGLFVMGKQDYLKADSLAIVGSRKATDYGYQVLDSLMPSLVREGLVIVSGLARGIDSYAHQLALNHGGRTLAVIGTGLDRVYPKENYDLQVKLAKDHCVVSEYPPRTEADRSHFPMRNRIISGLSLGCLVVEAFYRSGSLITANLALNEGREVFAIPGSLFSKSSQGTNDLIKHGAKCVMSAQDILEDLSLCKNNLKL